MEWSKTCQEMREDDSERFSDIVSQLFDRTFIVRELWDARAQRMVANPSYRFVTRFLECLRTYLDFGGFDLQVDNDLGVVALYSRYGRNREPLDKVTTYFLMALRLLFIEKMEQAKMRQEPLVALSEVFNRLRVLDLTMGKLPVKGVEKTLASLRRLSIIELVDGDASDPESRWLIYPSIRILVPDERIHDALARIQSLEAAGAGEEEDL